MPIQQSYGSNNQAITITLASLASSATAGRESAVIDNGTNKFLDALVSGKVKPTTGTIANDKATYVYAYGTTDDGTTYSDTATGSDAAITLSDPPNMRLIGVINTPVQNTQYKAGPFSVAAAFGGVLPAKWGIVVRNYCGIAYTSTGSDHGFWYQGVEAESV